MATVETPSRAPVSPRDDELLIKEARTRARRRRWTIGLILLAVITVTLAIVGGGKQNPPKAATARSQPSSRSGVSGSHNAVTPVVPGGQSVQSVWPVGGETTWVFTMNVTSLTRHTQVVEWSNNGGRTWRNATPSGYGTSAGQRPLGAFIALSARRAWVVVGSTTSSNQPSARLLTTDNGGRTWSVTGTVPSTSCTVSFSSADTGICTSSLGAGNAAPLALYVTDDGGRSWSKTFDNTGGFAGGGSYVGDGGLPYTCDKKFSMTAGNVVWANFWCNASYASLYRSPDAGRTWSAVTLTQPSSVLPGGAEFTGPVVLSGKAGAVAFADGTASLVYVTHDGGHSFTPVYPPGPVHPWAVDIVSPTVWRLAYRNQLLFTNDAGTSWTGLSDDAFSSSVVRRSQRYDSGAPATLNFTTPSFGWMSWFTGNGYIVMSTRNGGRTWYQVTVPGTGSHKG